MLPHPFGTMCQLMGTSVSSPCTSPHVSQLPDQFSIAFDRDELLIALRWCERFAPADGGESVAVVSLEAKQRRWMFVEENVMGYYVNGESSPCIGVIPVSQQLLSIATDATTNDTITIEFNVLLGVYRLHIARAVIELAMPRDWDIDPRFTSSRPEKLIVEASEIVAMGRAFMAPVVDRSGADKTLANPFITCDVANGVLTARRTWKRWGGQTMSVSLPVNSGYTGSFSFNADVVVREMYCIDTYCEGSIALEVATSGNPVISVRGQQCGFSFIASEEYVHDVRQSVIDAVTDIACDLDVVAGNEWDSTVQVVSQSLEVDITIMANSNNVAEYVRVSRLVADDVRWNLELAEEINSWNSALINTKLVRSGSQLSVIADVFVESLSTLPEVIDDVLSRAGKVNDFIAVFQ